MVGKPRDARNFYKTAKHEAIRKPKIETPRYSTSLKLFKM
jgi:hypothetical protein